jgi:hypothetical protein
LDSHFFRTPGHWNHLIPSILKGQRHKICDFCFSLDIVLPDFWLTVLTVSSQALTISRNSNSKLILFLYYFNNFLTFSHVFFSFLILKGSTMLSRDSINSPEWPLTQLRGSTPQSLTFQEQGRNATGYQLSRSRSRNTAEFNSRGVGAEHSRVKLSRSRGGTPRSLTLWEGWNTAELHSPGAGL